jgi:hypothetical protein
MIEARPRMSGVISLKRDDTKRKNPLKNNAKHESGQEQKGS